MRSNVLKASLLVLAFGLSACPKKTADLELDAARAAMDAARRAMALYCAKQTFLAAESALAEAQRLADDGEIEEAQKKASEDRNRSGTAGTSARCRSAGIDSQRPTTWPGKRRYYRTQSGPFRLYSFT